MTQGGEASYYDSPSDFTFSTELPPALVPQEPPAWALLASWAVHLAGDEVKAQSPLYERRKATRPSRPFPQQRQTHQSYPFCGGPSGFGKEEDPGKAELLCHLRCVCF